MQPQTRRVFVAGLGCENNTFSPIPTTLDDFKALCWLTRDQPIPQHQSVTLLLKAVEDRAPQLGWTVLRGLMAAAQPGGIIARAAYEQARDQLLEDLRESQPVDAVLLALHGAMVAHGYDDCEADIQRRVREIAGPDAFIGSVLDPHCHMTEEKLATADAIVLIKEYPHTDIFERAQDLVDICARTLAGEIRPVMAMARSGIIDMIHTTRAPGNELVRRLFAIEREPGVISASAVHGFPWGDVPAMGTGALVVADRDHSVARCYAEEIAAHIAERRGQWHSPLTTLEEMLRDLRAPREDGRPIVIADTADNPGGGAPSDSTYVIDALRRDGLLNLAVGILWDPGAVRLAIGAGVGSELELRLAGKVCRRSGAPLDLTVRVMAIAENTTQQFGGAPWPTGTLVWLRDGETDYVVGENRVQCFTTEAFSCLDIDLAKKEVVLVKSSQHFHASFAPIASRVLYVNSPGVCDLNLRSLEYRRVHRPLWPLDDAAGQVRGTMTP